MTCSICNGTGHLFDEPTGHWRRCSCLEVAVRNERCRQADLPEPYWALTADQLVAVSPQLVAVKRSLVNLIVAVKGGVGLTGQWCLTGPLPSVKLVAALLLKAQMYVLPNGMWVSLEDATVSYLHDRDRVVWNRARSVPTLAIVAGQEWPNRMDTHLLNYLLDERWLKQATIVATALSPDRLIEQYGDRPLWRSAMQLPAEAFA